MDTTMIIGVSASLLLVIGSALSDVSGVHPMKVRRNQFFAVGNVGMALYTILRTLAGGSVLFLFSQGLIITATVLMLLQIRDSLSRVIILSMGILLASTAFFVVLEPKTLLFVAGLTMLGIGFASSGLSISRNVYLALGSVIIAIFSYLSADAVFLWLNVFFAGFSAYNAIKLRFCNFRSVTP